MSAEPWSPSLGGNVIDEARAEIERYHNALEELRDQIRHLRSENLRLEAEVAMWKERCEAVQADFDSAMIDLDKALERE